MSSRRCVRILGTGKYLPSKKVLPDHLDLLLDRPKGWTRKKSLIDERSHVTTETSSEMGAYALQSALKNSGLSPSDLDLIVAASSVPEQLIPSTSVLIQKKLGLENSGIPCFDVNSTCLSFITAFDLASHLLSSGQYRNIAIVSSEIASRGLSPKDFKSFSLFGDGAAAVVLQSTTDPQTGVLGSHMETYSSASDLCRILAGGNRFNPMNPPQSYDDYLFQMDGLNLYRFAFEKISPFFSTLLKKAGVTLSEVDLVIPHQASPLALEHMRKHLEVPKTKWVEIIRSHGNQVAASLPTALHESITHERLKPGMTALLFGTAAGVTFSGLVLRY